MAAECVKVIVRCRPMNEREYSLKCECVLEMIAARAQCAISNPHDKKAPPKHFTFDGAYFTDSTTENIYNEIAYPLVEGVTEGYNGTIFAYGQTGCGKSFTMQGITDPPTQRGIIPRAFDHVFETVSVAETTKFLIHASYCEIYNEEIRDLLGKDVKEKLELHEHPERGVYVNGLSQHPVHNVVECEKIMQKGWRNRATGSTLMNADSSRSHSIFTINLEMMTADDAGEEHIRAGKLNLVDLAGSERQAKTGATGARLKEATKINLSLSALGNVISALVDGKSKHIPYRDSKLTRLLQDSLGGNTKTLMVACLSPADNNYDETLSTLRYANRAKNIKNKPKINEDPKDALLRQYQEEIQKLKAMLMGQLPIPAGGFSDIESIGAPSVKSENQIAREELEYEKERIREEYDNKLKDMQQQYEEEKVSKVKLQQDMVKLRAFYDEKLQNVDGELEKIPSTAEEKRSNVPDSEQMRMMAFRQFMEHFKPRSKVLGEVDSSEELESLDMYFGSQIEEAESAEVKEGKKKKKGDKGVVVGAATAGAAIVRNADGTPMRDAEGKIMTKGDTKVVSKTELVEVDKNGEPVERPSSVLGQDLPPGPDEKYYMDAEGNIYSEQELQETGSSQDLRLSSVSSVGDEAPLPAPASQVPSKAPSQTPVQVPGLDKEVTFVNGEMHLQSSQASGDVIVRPIAVPGQDGLAAPGSTEKKLDDEGTSAPRSSPTHAPMQEQLRFQQEEALKRLHELEQQMVGGEQIDNVEMKERRKKRKTFAEERKRRLAEAIAKMDDDGIMLQIYDNIGDELKAKNKLLEKEKEKYEEASREILDIQSEFEFERIDYLDTIRKQERQLLLMQDLIDRISPCIRKDCNYSNIDRIKMDCKWDEEQGKWILPKLTIERTALPVSGTILPGAGGSRSPRMSNGDIEEYDDRFREVSPPAPVPKLMRKQDKSGQYFQTKRPSQLIQSSEPLNKVNMGEIKQSYNIQPAHNLPATNGYRGSLGDEPISRDLMAAKVHGQIMNDEGITRKPTRLEALPSVGKKSKKKRNAYDGM